MVDTKTPPSPPSAKRPLLDLDTLIVRPIVRIDQVEYELRAPDELSVLENHRLVLLAKRTEAMEALQEATDDEEVEYAQLLDTFCRRVLLAPPDVIGRLLIPQRVAVIVSFSQLWLQKVLQATRAIEAAAEAAKAAIAAEAQKTTPHEDPTGAFSSPPSSTPLEAAQ